MKYRQGSMQLWEVGQMVKVGFLTLTITGLTCAGRSWTLIDAKGRTYIFTPYNGLERIA